MAPKHRPTGMFGFALAWIGQAASLFLFSSVASALGGLAGYAALVMRSVENILADHGALYDDMVEVALETGGAR